MNPVRLMLLFTFLLFAPGTFADSSPVRVNYSSANYDGFRRLFVTDFAISIYGIVTHCRNCTDIQAVTPPLITTYASPDFTSVKFWGNTYSGRPPLPQYNKKITKVTFKVRDSRFGLSATEPITIEVSNGTTGSVFQSFTLPASQAEGLVTIENPPIPFEVRVVSRPTRYSALEEFDIYYEGEATSSLDLKFDAISVSPAQVTANGKFSVKPDVEEIVKIKIKGTGFNSVENRSAQVKVKIGDDNSIPPVDVSLAQLKTDPNNEMFILIPYIFSADQAGEVPLRAEIISTDDIDPSNNMSAADEKMYVLCDAEDKLSKKIPYFPQGGTSSWANDGLNGNPQEPLKLWGCMVSNVAMLMNVYGINKTFTGEDVTPGTVNSGLASQIFSKTDPTLSKYNGFLPNGRMQENGAVAFARKSYYQTCLNQPSADLQVCLDRSKAAISYKGEYGSNHDKSKEQKDIYKKQINAELCKGNPIIVRVPSMRPENRNNPEKMHFVLAKSMFVTDSGELTYLVANPGRASLFNQVLPEADLRGFKKYVPTDDPSMIFVHLSGAKNMIVTDPMGRRSGFDPYTQTRFDEIPGARYFGPEALDSPEASSIQMATDTKWEGLEPLNGRYNVKVFSMTNVNYSLTTYMFDTTGTINGAQQKSGSIRANQTSEIFVDHTDSAIVRDFSKIQIKKALYKDTVRNDKAYIEGRIITRTGALPDIKKGISVSIGSFTKTIEVNRLSKLVDRLGSYKVFLDWGRNGMAVILNSKNGEFKVYIDSAKLDDSNSILNTNIEIQLDNLTAQGAVQFKQIPVRKKGHR